MIFINPSGVREDLSHYRRSERGGSTVYAWLHGRLQEYCARKTVSVSRTQHWPKMLTYGRAKRTR
jgi:hypothetical protein